MEFGKSDIVGTRTYWEFSLGLINYRQIDIKPHNQGKGLAGQRNLCVVFSN